MTNKDSIGLIKKSDWNYYRKFSRYTKIENKQKYLMVANAGDPEDDKTPGWVKVEVV